MLLFANLVTAFEQILANKLRSLLTVLGVIIAVMSTMVIVSVIAGFSNYVTGMLQGLGSNVMWIVPQRPLTQKTAVPAEMSQMDLEEVASRCPAVERLAPMTGTELRVTHENQATKAMVVATSDDYQRIRGLEVDVGRGIGPVDVANRQHVCVLGRDVVERLEADEAIVGSTILLGQQPFQVIGLLKKKGTLLGERFDDFLLVPYTTFLKHSPIHGYFLAFIAQATSTPQVPEAEAQIINVLRRRHELGPDSPNDFQIRTQEQILSEFRRLRLIGGGVLVGIVAISLLVGGIGIMNVMLVSVTERTREIGLRKAVGARRRDILAQFLTEAAVLCGLGGGIGVVLGYGITAILSLHPAMIDVSVPAWAAFLGVGFSALVGVVFGMLPAVKAAIIQPIEALRYE